MIYESIDMCKSTFIYNYDMCRWHDYRYVLVCTIVAICMECYWLNVYCLWCASMWIVYNYEHISVTVWCTIKLLQKTFHHIPNNEIAYFGGIEHPSALGQRLYSFHYAKKLLWQS